MNGGVDAENTATTEERLMELQLHLPATLDLKGSTEFTPTTPPNPQPAGEYIA